MLNNGTEHLLETACKTKIPFSLKWGICAPSRRNRLPSFMAHFLVINATLNPNCTQIDLKMRF